MHIYSLHYKWIYSFCRVKLFYPPYIWYNPFLLYNTRILFGKENVKCTYKKMVRYQFFPYSFSHAMWGAINLTTYWGSLCFLSLIYCSRCFYDLIISSTELFIVSIIKSFYLFQCSKKRSLFSHKPRFSIMNFPTV